MRCPKDFVEDLMEKKIQVLAKRETAMLGVSKSRRRLLGSLIQIWMTNGCLSITGEYELLIPALLHVNSYKPFIILDAYYAIQIQPIEISPNECEGRIINYRSLRSLTIS